MLIDHSFISKNQLFEASVLESTLGVDHFTIVYQSSFKIDHSDKKRQFLIRNTKKYSRSNFNRDIALQDWSPMYQINEPNEMFLKFIEMFENILRCHAPLKLVESSTKKQQKQWLTKELRGLINEKHRLFNAWKKNPKSEVYNIYKSLRNSVNRKLKKAADDYTKNFFQQLPTSREQWKFIKNRINSNSQIEKIDKLREDSHFVEDDREIANVLNNCFARLGLYKGKDVAPNCSSLTFDGPEFSFRPVTRKELYNVIYNLPKHKSPGPGYIPAWALKDSKLSIGTHLQFVVNECINNNTFPNILKTAHVTPVYKKGDRLEPENYRPISVTPTLAKIFGRLLLEQLTRHLTLNGLINKNQFGFQKQKSCLDTIISLTEKINQCVDENEIVVTLFLDLAKAFNSISIDVFMNKIKRYGIGENARILLNSFLCDRKQCVKNGIAKSDWVVINHGVPQGPVLGPLIFILYVNDFSEAVSTNCDVLQFADETAILCHAKNKANLQLIAEDTLNKTDQYMKQNRLTLNEKKTELMVFRNEKLPIIETVDFKGHRLEASEKCRYLGVIIDRKLTYQNQLSKVISKMASAIRSIYLVRYQVPLKTRINFFKSLVLSHLDFSAIFFQNLPSYSIDRINKQINWGIKVCFMKTKYDTARDLLLETKILPAELQITRVSLNRFFNILQQTRNCSNKHFRFLENVPIIVNKRTHNLFLEQKCKSKWSNGSIVRNFIRKWNTLPITIRKETSKTKFKQKVTAEMLKRHERIPIDRRVAGFKHIFY